MPAPMTRARGCTAEYIAASHPDWIGRPADMRQEGKGAVVGGVPLALGHANRSATQIYLHLVDEDLEAALRAFHGNQ